MPWGMMNHGAMMPGMPFGQGYPLIWGFVGLGTTVLFWGGLLFLIVWAVRSVAGRQGPAAPPDSLTILKTRYARGEVTKELYDQMRADLTA